MKSIVVVCFLAAATANHASEFGGRPFNGKALPIPGIIEAEHFDEGEEGKAYHDLEPKNQGAPYRATGVDIEHGKHVSGGYGIGWIKAGEWLAFSVDVAETGSYTLEIAVTSKGKGGTLHIEFGGDDKTGPLQIPDTGAWTTVKVFTKPDVKLKAGQQVMRVVMDANGDSSWVGDIDYFRFIR